MLAVTVVRAAASGSNSSPPAATVVGEFDDPRAIVTVRALRAASAGDELCGRAIRVGDRHCERRARRDLLRRVSAVSKVLATPTRTRKATLAAVALIEDGSARMSSAGATMSAVLASDVKPGALAVIVALPRASRTAWTKYVASVPPLATGISTNAVPPTDAVRERTARVGSLLVIRTVTPPCWVAPRRVVTLPVWRPAPIVTGSESRAIPGADTVTPIGAPPDVCRRRRHGRCPAGNRIERNPAGSDRARRAEMPRHNSRSVFARSPPWSPAARPPDSCG